MAGLNDWTALPDRSFAWQLIVPKTPVPYHYSPTVKIGCAETGSTEPHRNDKLGGIVRDERWPPVTAYPWGLMPPCIPKLSSLQLYCLLHNQTWFEFVRRSPVFCNLSPTLCRNLVTELYEIKLNCWKLYWQYKSYSFFVTKTIFVFI